MLPLTLFSFYFYFFGDENNKRKIIQTREHSTVERIMDLNLAVWFWYIQILNDPGQIDTCRSVLLFILEWDWIKY